MKNKQNQYIEKLINQYVNSEAIKHIDMNSKMFKQEFVLWINQMQKISQGYLELLKDLNVEFDSQDMAEIGKGKYDSIVLNNNSTIMITPYIDEEISNPVAHYQFTVSDYRPAVIYNDSRNRFINIGNIMTQNPYSESDIFNWNQLHNSKTCNITIGVYGKVSDKNRKLKIKLLENFSKELDSNFNMDGYEYKNNYYYAVTSHKKVLKKVKTL